MILTSCQHSINLLPHILKHAMYTETVMILLGYTNFVFFADLNRNKNG